MRSYPRNSPQAAARIVVLAMLADGHLSGDEVDALERFDADEQLGLDSFGIHAVVREFCEDLLIAAELAWSDACRIDPRALCELMAEVDDPTLRRKVLRLCVSVVEADAHVADGESIVLAAAVRHWGLEREMLDAPGAPKQTRRRAEIATPHNVA